MGVEYSRRTVYTLHDMDGLTCSSARVMKCQPPTRCLCQFSCQNICVKDRGYLGTVSDYTCPQRSGNQMCFFFHHFSRTRTRISLRHVSFAFQSFPFFFDCFFFNFATRSSRFVGERMVCSATPGARKHVPPKKDHPVGFPRRGRGRLASPSPVTLGWRGGPTRPRAAAREGKG